MDPCPHATVLPIDAPGCRPTRGDGAWVCVRCGLIQVTATAGRRVIVTTFRLTPQQLRAAGRAVVHEESK